LQLSVASVPFVPTGKSSSPWQGVYPETSMLAMCAAVTVSSTQPAPTAVESTVRQMSVPLGKPVTPEA